MTFKYLLIVGAAGALAAVAMPAAAQDGSASAPAPAPVKPKKVCRSITPTGSIMSKRFCLTREEWAKFNEQNGKHADMMLSNRTRALSQDAMNN